MRGKKMTINSVEIPWHCDEYSGRWTTCRVICQYQCCM